MGAPRRLGDVALRSLLVALLVGALQGVLEWLPISSEGNVSLVLAALGTAPEFAVQLSLFLHLGTAVAATVYYRRDLRDVLASAGRWQPREAFRAPTADLSFLLVATLVSGVVGIGAYVLLVDLVTGLAGGVFAAGVGVLLIATGAFQRLAAAGGLGERETPDALDAVLVGIGQGLAILPGISRSGTTVGLLLLRGHRGESAFDRSFVLSVPAALGAGGIAIADTGGLPGVGLGPALVALGAAAVVGYAAIGALLRVVERVPFWAVCAAVGALALVGGLLAA